MADTRPGLFAGAALWTARQSGRPAAFGVALGVVLLWALSGAVFGYSDRWQAWIGTGTSILTFLLVFLIQNSQNRDTAAIQLKLDELIRSSQHARNAMLGLDDLTEAQLERVRASMKDIGKAAPEVLEELADLEDAREDLAKAGEEITAAEDKIAQARSPARG